MRSGDVRVSQFYEARTQLAARKEAVDKAKKTYDVLKRRFDGTVKTKKGTLLIEIKPFKQTQPPVITESKRKTKKYNWIY